MAEGKNEEFIADPLKFIQKTAVDITLFDKSITGRPKYLGDTLTEDSWLAMNTELVSALRTTSFDLSPLVHKGWTSRRDFCVLRFDRETFGPESLEIIQRFRKAKSQEVFSNFQKLVAQVEKNPSLQDRLDHSKRAMETFPQRYDNGNLEKFVKSTTPLRGYFFPYKSPPQNDDVLTMGHVDVPFKDPEYDFVFTGMMNGCALVFTQSPVGTTHFRVYHYPNVSSYPQFKDSKFWAGQIRWAVWTVEEYGSAEDPNAFNFLHYDRKDNLWYLHCQPQTQNQVSKGVVMSIRQRVVRGASLPGRIPLTKLGNDFPDTYV